MPFFFATNNGNMQVVDYNLLNPPTINNGLTWWYKFNNSFIDSISGSASLVNTASTFGVLSSGTVNSYNGVSTYLYINTNTFTNTTQSAIIPSGSVGMTICFWVYYPTSFSNNYYGINFTGGIYNFNCLWAAGAVFFVSTNGSGYTSPGQGFVTSYSPVVNTWYHQALTFNPITNLATYYINGVSYATTGLVNNGGTLSATTMTCVVGGTAGYGAMNQYLQDFRFYNNRVLSAIDIANIMKTGY